MFSAPRVLFMLGAVGAALFVAMVDASRNYAANAMIGRQVAWFGAFMGSAPSWVTVAILTPLPLVVVQRAPVGGARWAAAAALHAAGALAFAAAHVVLASLYIGWQRGDLTGFAGIVSKMSSTFIVDLVLYAAIAGCGYALRFSREARDRALAATRLQASLVEARLAALRGQINPHFLFNTLNAISTLALEGRHQEVVRTLGTLGELLRRSLDDDRPQEVTLDEELESLRLYLEIQRTRLGERLTVTERIEPEARQALVPTMVLQPIVENAIVHGIARTPGPGTVTVGARREGASLRIEVEDTGPGFGAHAGAGTARSPIGRGPGIGLANTRARLRELYGEAQRLDAAAAAGGGGRVSILLPFRPVEP